MSDSDQKSISNLSPSVLSDSDKKGLTGIAMTLTLDDEEAIKKDMDDNSEETDYKEIQRILRMSFEALDHNGDNKITTSDILAFEPKVEGRKTCNSDQASQFV